MPQENQPITLAELCGYYVENEDYYYTLCENLIELNDPEYIYCEEDKENYKLISDNIRRDIIGDGKEVVILEQLFETKSMLKNVKIVFYENKNVTYAVTDVVVISNQKTIDCYRFNDTFYKKNGKFYRESHCPEKGVDSVKVIKNKPKGEQKK